MTVPMIKSIGDVPYPIDVGADALSPQLTAGAALGITGDGPTDSAAWLQRVSTADGPTTIRSIQGNTIVESGSLLPVNMTGIETTGFNQWDEEWEAGVYNTSNGNKSSATTSIRSTNMVPVMPSTQYHMLVPHTSVVSGFAVVLFYDADGAYLHSYTQIASNGMAFTVPSDAHYLTFYVSSQYGTTYKGDICINLSDPTRNGTYEPYWQQQRTIPAGTLRSAGSVYDELTETERITRVGERAYQSGDESDPTVTTDGTITYYPLTTPTVTPIDPPLNLSYRVDDFGTERVMVPEGERSAPPTIVAAQGYTAESLRDAALSAIAPVENGLASTNYGVGSYLVHGGQLCKVTVAIATGEAITIGTNVTATTVMAEILSLVQ